MCFPTGKGILFIINFTFNKVSSPYWAKLRALESKMRQGWDRLLHPDMIAQGRNIYS